VSGDTSHHCARCEFDLCCRCAGIEQSPKKKKVPFQVMIHQHPTASGTALRPDPDPKQNYMRECARNGQQVNLLKTHDVWALIELPGSKVQGWVRRSFLTPVKDARDQWKPVKKIGEGAFGICLLMENEFSKAKAVLKVIKIERIEILALSVREIQALSELDHKHILGMYMATSGADDGVPHIDILMEYCNGGDFDAYLEGPNFQLNVALELYKQALLGLKYLHEFQPEPFLHRDLKPANIFLHRDDPAGPLIAKLGDLGMARKVDPKALQNRMKTYDKMSQVGSPAFMAPELFLGVPRYGYEVDIWSMGVILFYILQKGELPFSSIPPVDLAIVDGAPAITFEAPATLKDPVHAAYQPIINAMLRPPGQQRPTAQEVLDMLSRC
jgi:serine/threonine protein kinase